MGRRGYPAELRRRVLALPATGQPLRMRAAELGITEQTILTWLRQDRIDQWHGPGLSSAGHAELQSARRRSLELETEVAVHRLAVRASSP